MKTLRPSLLILLLVLVSVLPLTGCAPGPDLTVGPGGISQGAALDGLLARTQRAMAQVNSVDSAKKANEDLIRINEDYDDLLFHMQKLEFNGRIAMAKKSMSALPEMQRMVAQIHEMPALDDILGETLDLMVEKLGMVR